MRVISGIRKGHKLKTPKGLSTRPTEDKIKESLFNIMGRIDGEAIILDLFAGSGSIGIEFLSRGASKAYFVDRSRESTEIIKENLNHTKLTEKASVLRGDALKALENFKESQLVFNYIYLDPPFDNHELLLKALGKIEKENLLSENGLLIIEHEKNLLLDDEIFSFSKYDSRVYGNKTITFYKKNF